MSKWLTIIAMDKLWWLAYRKTKMGTMCFQPMPFSISARDEPFECLISPQERLFSLILWLWSYFIISSMEHFSEWTSPGQSCSIESCEFSQD